MEHGVIQSWIDAYIKAWKTYDPELIGALFSEDAAYAFNPFDRPDSAVRGREAIIANWLEEQDPPGSWEASYAPVMVSERSAFISGITRYTNGRTFRNLWHVQFDENDQCNAFVEWYMKEPS